MRDSWKTMRTKKAMTPRLARVTTAGTILRPGARRRAVTSSTSAMVKSASGTQGTSRVRGKREKKPK
jgi:hypothetical protein